MAKKVTCLREAPVVPSRLPAVGEGVTQTRTQNAHTEGTCRVRRRDSGGKYSLR